MNWIGHIFINFSVMERRFCNLNNLVNISFTMGSSYILTSFNANNV